MVSAGPSSRVAWLANGAEEVFATASIDELGEPKMMRVLPAGVAVCSVSALYAIEWGADTVAVLDVAGATETLSGSQALCARIGGIRGGVREGDGHDAGARSDPARAAPPASSRARA